MLELSKENIVKYIPGKGLKLNIFTEKVIREAYEIRKLVEGLIINKVCNKINESEFEKIDKLLKSQIKYYLKNDEISFIEIDKEFLVTPEAKLLNELRKPLMENFGLLRNGCAGVIKNSSVQHNINGPLDLIDKVLEMGKSGLTINRYKGLGEMNPEELWETTLNPEKRILLQVKYSNKTKAKSKKDQDLIQILMGDEVAPRKDFIITRALEVSNLDI